MTVIFTRRAMVGGLLSGAAGVALAEAPLSSLRPKMRAGDPAPALAPETSPVPRVAPRERTTIAELIDAANLDGKVSVMLADAETGEIVESLNADEALPPASVTKAVTALYALDALGPDYHFVTRIFATGPIVGGVLDGDLILSGGGDPTLSSDDLADIVAELQTTGLKEITGDFLCWRGALPYAEEIEPSQMDYLGYNPAVSGLNLNYNRVHFKWSKSGNGWDVELTARTETRVPPVTMASVRVEDRDGAVFTVLGPDRWTVKRSALGNGGSRWMPVRQPALYCGDVFRGLAADAGITLPAPTVVDELPEERTEFIRHRSAPLREILNEMLLYSTNLTAEICGLTATRARSRTALGIRASAAQMNQWAGQEHGIECGFVDHSGLSDEDRISAGDMTKLLVSAGADSPVRPLMKRITLRDQEGNLLEHYPAVVRAKTGTLNFVSALSGYIQSAEGKDLAFAILTASPERRAVGIASGDEIPEGARAWNSRSKRLQYTLLRRWGVVSRGVIPEDAAATVPQGG
ncbi:D-alanyl-D-alanine carboxypeptidase/D-alanyl-D-alanine endopeptidase [Thalassorhabdomicrobium marinisediminis]|uniref:D-alanyl-D-alanine carboxypeptidase/D-alanyl-D-alanine-endopeptidase n=1 Tax=Thalassorhabdomicrobium marinisediminis TaxID=2170577 RepID=A0A2T7FVL5_9RHOB|nr:D-alanyl-D-alanine carboxypeptidase/D-alanyl-D-alanine-endopeptidase [Thalassorhabdomicrobium marinisediminis]PVA06197.1 D-alanyl-D-alanine carboxypeptidase/D-alanyl-D-alanine-endopeptidase [Thalassorhabdomicrobium marinisediminis]